MSNNPLDSDTPDITDELKRAMKSMPGADFHDPDYDVDCDGNTPDTDDSKVA